MTPHHAMRWPVRVQRWTATSLVHGVDAERDGFNGFDRLARFLDRGTVGGECGWFLTSAWCRKPHAVTWSLTQDPLAEDLRRQRAASYRAGRLCEHANPRGVDGVPAAGGMLSRGGGGPHPARRVSADQRAHASPDPAAVGRASCPWRSSAGGRGDQHRGALVGCRVRGPEHE